MLDGYLPHKIRALKRSLDTNLRCGNVSWTTGKLRFLNEPSTKAHILQIVKFFNVSEERLVFRLIGFSIVFWSYITFSAIVQTETDKRQFSEIVTWPPHNTGSTKGSTTKDNKLIFLSGRLGNRCIVPRTVEKNVVEKFSFPISTVALSRHKSYIVKNWNRYNAS